MAQFAFVTRWELAAPIETVWAAIVQYETWPQWWPAVKAVIALAPGDPVTGLGRRSRLDWRTPLGYGLSFETTVTVINPPSLLVATAQGQLIGEGRWQLTPTVQGTEVLYFWTVTTTQRWMDLMALGLRPLMTWNHDAVMAQGGEGLARSLNCALLKNEAVSSSTNPARA